MITITTDSQTTDGEEPIHTGDKIPETDKITEVDVPPPTITSAEHSARKRRCQHHQLAAVLDICETPRPHRRSRRTTQPETAGEEEIHGNQNSKIGFVAKRGENKNTVRFEEKNKIRRSSRIKTAKQVEHLGGLEYF